MESKKKKTVYFFSGQRHFLITCEWVRNKKLMKALVATKVVSVVRVVAKEETFLLDLRLRVQMRTRSLRVIKRFVGRSTCASSSARQTITYLQLPAAARETAAVLVVRQGLRGNVTLIDFAVYCPLFCTLAKLWKNNHRQLFSSTREWTELICLMNWHKKVNVQD